MVITEIGGTTGDIESQPFLEAIRQVGIEQGLENCCYIHVVLVPYISGSNEYKSKPAQHSCKELQGMGILPNVIVLRADGSVGRRHQAQDQHVLQRAAPSCVIENLTMPSLYECPLMLEAAGLTDVVARQLHLETAAVRFGRMEGPDLPHRHPQPQLHHRAGGQVCQAARRLSERDGKPVPRRL